MSLLSGISPVPTVGRFVSQMGYVCTCLPEQVCKYVTGPAQERSQKRDGVWNTKEIMLLLSGVVQMEEVGSSGVSPRTTGRS